MNARFEMQTPDGFTCSIWKSWYDPGTGESGPQEPVSTTVVRVTAPDGVTVEEAFGFRQFAAAIPLVCALVRAHRVGRSMQSLLCTFYHTGELS